MSYPLDAFHGAFGETQAGVMLRWHLARPSTFRAEKVMPDTFHPPANLSGLCILVIENDPDNLELFAAFLRQCGAHVATAESAPGALGYFDGQRIDIILTDVSVLNAMSATGFISEVRDRPQYKSIPVIAVTGWPQNDPMCRHGDFSAFMQKPVDLDHLVSMVQKLVVVQ